MRLAGAAACLTLTACTILIGQSPAAGSNAESAGARAFQKCYSCHSLQPAEHVGGPTLHDVVGRKVAAQPDFRYSNALRQFASRQPVWTRDLLDRFIADPEAVVPGTTMSFVGIRDPEERAALIAYLQSAE